MTFGYSFSIWDFSLIFSAFMRLTRRKYESAYESSLHSPSGPSQLSHPNPTGVSYSPHHSPLSTTGVTGLHRSPNTALTAPQTLHASQSGFDANTGAGYHKSTCDVKSNGPLSHSNSALGGQPTGADNSASGGVLHSPTGGDGVPPRTSPASMLAHQLHQPAYPAHSLFAQNPAAAASFLHTALPFYPTAYHAAAAAAVGVSSHLAPFSFPPAAYGFPGGEFFATNTTNAGASHTTTTSQESAKQTNGQPRIWRSVDTDRLESDDNEVSKSQPIS